MASAESIEMRDAVRDRVEDSSSSHKPSRIDHAYERENQSAEVSGLSAFVHGDANRFVLQECCYRSIRHLVVFT
jgi:hypothetical protein